MQNPHDESGKDPIYRTRIEQRFKEKQAQGGGQLPPVKERAWYFSASFANVQDGTPVGYLRRYEKGDMLLHPRAETAVNGKVVGDVRFADGKAMFNGNGHIEFHITAEHEQALDTTKLDDMFLSPKPLLMLGSGQVDRAAYSDSAYANPIVFYRTGQSNFGLFVPDGSMVSKINQEVLRTTTGAAGTELPQAVWYAHIAETYPNEPGDKLYRYVHDIIDCATLDYLNKREFFVYEPFQLPLTAGSAFYIGHAPMAGASPFRGWLEEVIFDPCSGSGNGGGGKPSEEH